MGRKDSRSYQPMGKDGFGRRLDFLGIVKNKRKSSREPYSPLRFPTGENQSLGKHFPNIFRVIIKPGGFPPSPTQPSTIEGVGFALRLDSVLNTLLERRARPDIGNLSTECAVSLAQKNKPERAESAKRSWESKGRLPPQCHVFPKKQGLIQGQSWLITP